jgi:endonuclease/exonuclease/phosphatase (EEP) superfamily protein YafD
LAAAGARRYWLIWVAVVPVALWALVRSLGLDSGPLLVPLLAFTPYALIAAFLVAGVAVALRNWVAAAVAALATLALSAAVLPRAIGDGTVDAAGHETLAVLSANIRRGTADPAALIGLVERRHLDLLAVQELTPESVRELDAAGLGRLLPHRVLAVYPGKPKKPGVGIYSRLPLRGLPPHDNYGVGAALRMPSGRLVRVVNVHPHTPKPGHIGEWRESLEGLPSAGAGSPRVLLGDFNATLDQAELRDLVDRGYRNAGEVAGMGLEPTYPRRGWPDLGPLITIDHVLADERLGIVDYGVLEQPGSDHRAIHAVLSLPWQRSISPRR